MKRRVRYSLKALLVGSILVGALLATYIQRVRSLHRFHLIESEISEKLPGQLDEDLTERLEQSGLLPIVHGVSGGGFSRGGLFSGSEFEKSYRVKIRFQVKDGATVWPEGGKYSVDLDVNARLGLFNSQPEIEIIDFGSEYNTIGVELMRQYFIDGFGIQPAIIESASRD